jgi:hypothetical protein
MAEGWQTASKFSFHWWGANSTLSDRHQLDEPPGPHSVQNEALDVPEPRHAKSWSYTDSTRSASFPTNGNKIMTRFGGGACLFEHFQNLLWQGHPETLKNLGHR